MSRSVCTVHDDTYIVGQNCANALLNQHFGEDLTADKFFNKSDKKITEFCAKKVQDMYNVNLPGLGKIGEGVVNKVGMYLKEIDVIISQESIDRLNQVIKDIYSGKSQQFDNADKKKDPIAQA